MRVAGNSSQITAASPLPYRRFDELVAVGGGTAQGAKGHARARLTRVEREAGDGHVGGPVLGQHVYIGEQGKERQGNHGDVLS